MSSLINGFKGNKLINSSNIYNDGRLLNKVLENYNRIINQLPTVDGEGESITLNGCINAEFVKFKLKGNTYQNGEPSPSNEVPIQNVTGDNSIIVANSDNTISKTLNFTLVQGQKMYEGDYLADDGIHHVRTEKTFDGTETYWNFSTGTNRYSFWLNNTNSNIKAKTTRHAKKSNKFIYSNLGFSSAPIPSVCENSNNTVYMIIFNTDGTQGTTLNDWKSYLAQQYQNGTPLKLQYELVEEIIEPYTTTQKQQYEAIKRALSHAGVTIISQINDGLPFNLEVSALKDLHTLEYLNELNN